MIQRRVKGIGTDFVLLAAASLVLLYFSEAVAQNSLRQAFLPLANHPGYALAAFWVIFAAVLLLSMLTGRLARGFGIFSVVLWGLSTASYLKVYNTEVPLLPSDLMMAFGVGDVTRVRFSQVFKAPIVLMLLFIVAVIVFYARRKSGRGLMPLHRIGTALFAVISFSLLFFCGAYIRQSTVEPGSDYRENGFVYSFVAGFSMARYDDFERFCLNGEPYDLSRLKRVVEGVAPAEPVEDVSPDVIVILSESFDDFTRFDKLALSEDPSPFFRTLQAQYGSGTMLSQTFGGGTANVEFEVISSLVRRYINPGGMVYQTYDKGPLPSIVPYFKERGYTATALHNFKGDFYRRSKIMPEMGFDTFIAEEDMDSDARVGHFISDDHLTDWIIDTLEQGEGSQFVFAITMENHQDYLNKYDETEIKVQNEDLPEDMRNVIENYLTGVRHADQALQKLVQYIEARDRPTALLYFGDHKPTLAGSIDFYRYVGVYEDTHQTMTAQNKVDILSVPYVMYKNYGEDRTQTFEARGSNFLMNDFFTYAELEKPLLLRYLDSIKDEVRFFTRNDLFIDGAGNLYGTLPDSLVEIDKDYRILQYDTAFGKNYTAALTAEP